MGAAEGSVEGMPSPGARVFCGECWDLEEVGAAEGSVEGMPSPGTRVFCGECWDLDGKK